MESASIMLQHTLEDLSGFHRSLSSSKRSIQVTCRGTAICSPFKSSALCAGLLQFHVGLLSASAELLPVLCAGKRPMLTHPGQTAPAQIASPLVLPAHAPLDLRLSQGRACILSLRCWQVVTSQNEVHDKFASISMEERYTSSLLFIHAHLCISVTAPGKTLLL